MVAKSIERLAISAGIEVRATHIVATIVFTVLISAGTTVLAKLCDHLSDSNTPETFHRIV